MEHKFESIFNEMKAFYEELKIYPMLTDSLADMITYHTQDGTIQLISPAVSSLLGYTPEELDGYPFVDLCHPKDRSNVQAIFKKTVDHSGQNVTYRVRRKEGRYIWIETNFQNISDSREFVGIVGSSRDVTDRKREYEILKEREERFRLLVEQSQETIGICQEGKWVYLNDAGLELLGAVQIEEMIGQSVHEIVHPNDQTFFFQQMKFQETDPPPDPFELKLLREDGEERSVQMRWTPIMYKETPAQQVVIRDLTKQKETEEMLQQTEKLALAGQLAASVAHEIRNPLTSIKGFVQLLLPKMEGENERKYLDIMLNELGYVEAIISDLLLLSQSEATPFEEADLAFLLEQATTLLHSEALLHNIEIVLDIEPGLKPIECATNKMKQVFMNLLKNAIEATPGGKTVYIKAEMQGQVHILIRFVDEGSGIPKNRMSKLGEPFYSTKEKGTGLGLMVCKKIIDTHDGDLHVSSEENVGTTVDVLLPIKPGLL
ncbi:PAS domain-containing sensor histidine kinase [Shouchella shacheensis]|uniref:PAS domain-containing sensor histidine kinase n=1 Tax=Shouchella shacheensis TaxID=1649580 RepID=UPI0007400514|nr:PAS domain-containing sensor histidine kinase [Shouchella shacheensis]